MTSGTCPKCGSPDIKRSAAVYEQGTATTVGGIVGVGIGDGIGVGVAKTKGVQMTEAARRNAPPEANPLPGCAGMLAMVVVIVVGVPFVNSVGGFFSVVLLATTAFIAVAIFTWMKMKDTIAKERAAYDRQWHCMACGHTIHRQS